MRPEDVEAAREADGWAARVVTSARRGRRRRSEGRAQAGDTAANLWDRFTSKIGEMTDATGKRADE